MKKSLTLLFFGILCLTACKKSSSGSNSTFSATVDGKAATFNVSSATLVRSTASNEKRLDITGISTDNSKRLIITLTNNNVSPATVITITNGQVSNLKYMVLN